MELFIRLEADAAQPGTLEFPVGSRWIELLAGLEADSRDRSARQDLAECPAGDRLALDPDLADSTEQAFVQYRGNRLVAAEEEPEEFQPLQALPATGRGAVQDELDQGDGSGRLASLHDAIRDQAGRLDGDRPERDRIRRLELTADAVDCNERLELCAPGDRLPGNGLGRVGRARELDDRHRRDRPQVMREDHREQRIGDLGILIVELLANPCREEGERLDEPLDVGILAPVGCEFE